MNYYCSLFHKNEKLTYGIQSKVYYIHVIQTTVKFAGSLHLTVWSGTTLPYKGIPVELSVWCFIIFLT